LVGAAVLALASQSHAAPFFDAVGLVSNDTTLHPAKLQDPGLTNAWGLSYSPTSPFWISSNGAGTSPVYRVNPATQATTGPALVVTIPGDGSVTGQVFSGVAGAFNGDAFLFVSEDGTVSGWRGSLGTTAETLVLASDNNNYKGAALATVGAGTYLYGANFRSGHVDVFKGAAAMPDLTGSFTDPALPSGYAPFNVQNLNGTLYVAYAQLNVSTGDEVAGAGFGFVDSFDLQGNFIARVASGGALNAPWGLAIAPSSFGALAGSLLVGNFGDGRITAYDAATHVMLGQIMDMNGKPIEIDGLWALAPGNNGNAGSKDLLYFTAGPDEESHGLFGVLVAALQLTTAVSRKNHGTAEAPFDIDLLNANFGPECRSSGGNHTFVFNFTNNVTSGSASVTSGTGSVSGNPAFSTNNMTVDLTGVTDVQKITVTLSGVTDSFGQVLPNTAVSANMLIGDVNGNKTVNSTDVSQTKLQSGQAVTAANFREDIIPNGQINGSDVSQAKLRVGSGVP
jgi:uncharacterized protein (TIGR03118 family)